MGRSEIKLRKQLVPDEIHRHRNYDVLMKQHKRSLLFRQTVRYFLYSLIATVVVLSLIMISFYMIQLKK